MDLDITVIEVLINCNVVRKEVVRSILYFRFRSLILTSAAGLQLSYLVNQQLTCQPVWLCGFCRSFYYVTCGNADDYGELSAVMNWNPSEGSLEVPRKISSGLRLE